MLSKFSVRKPFTVLVAVVICLVLGFLSFQNMSTDFLPNMEFPYALVMTTYPGASPEEVEKAVSEPVEQAMERINNVKELQSISIQNMSMVVMSFNDGTDMGSTVVDMRESLDMVTVPELSFAVFDSTAPHELFPEGERDTVLDFYLEAHLSGIDERYESVLEPIKKRYALI